MGELTDEDARKWLSEYKKFTEQFWGDRCSEYEPDCWCCKAWKRYDDEEYAIEYAVG